MADDRQAHQPSLWERVRALVRAGDMAALVEQFTQEMTLLADGLCEEQARLRQVVDTLAQQRAEADDALAGQQQQQAQQIAELMRRIEALERRGRWRLGKGGWPWGRVLMGAGAIILLMALLR